MEIASMLLYSAMVPRIVLTELRPLANFCSCARAFCSLDGGEKTLFDADRSFIERNIVYIYIGGVAI